MDMLDNQATQVAPISTGPQHASATARRSGAPHLSSTELVDRLIASGLVPRESAERARQLTAQTGVHPVPGLLRLNAIAEAPLYRFYAEQMGLPLLGDSGSDVDALAAAAQTGATQLGLSPSWLSSKGVLFLRQGDAWSVAFREEAANDVRALVQRKSRALGTDFEWMLVPPSLYEQLLRAKREVLDTRVGTEDLRALRELAEEGPTIELVNSILSQAVTQRASDVHFEPEEFEFKVRVRVDGEMLEQTRQARDRFDAVACRLKILASLDIAERRLPQDGRINARVNGESFDIRVSILPGALGESIVLRLLRQERKPAQLEDLGMSASHATSFERWAALANGIVLVTGPTGSGKSTTLYTALELANDRTKKIITVEDPVEYKIRGITQLQVNSDIGFTFAAALRSILRHDPDIILVGEIRDEETARIAIQSALTGHLVLSTLHTNSAIGAVTRLADMGVEPFLIAASVRGLMAQRLVRCLCTHCAQPEPPDEALSALLERFSLQRGATPKRAIGCSHCSGTGYYGRRAIYDLIEVTPEVGHRIALGEGESQLLAALGPQVDQGLLRSGVVMAANGETTLGEVLRATGAA